MNKVDTITRESWILGNFPEWGTWLNEEIEQTEVAPGTFTMWWLGCTGIWLKSEGGANLCRPVGRARQGDPEGQGDGARTTSIGARSAPRRCSPTCATRCARSTPSPSAQLDAVLATHHHSDHIDANVAAAVLQNCDPSVPFIGPQACVDIWIGWGVPAERCRVVRPGDRIRIKDVEIVALDSFDRTVLVTAPKGVVLKGQPVQEMDDHAVNYLFETPGGNLYHSGDSHYSNWYAQHGNTHRIDVALASYGENPRGMTDKMTTSDVLRMAEALRRRSSSPSTTTSGRTSWPTRTRSSRSGGCARTGCSTASSPSSGRSAAASPGPTTATASIYTHRRGFEDAFADEPDLPFKALL